MDFISSPPKVDQFSTIMVVVDKFSIYATFIPLQGAAEETAVLFFKHIMKYWGLPHRDTRFTSIFWTELFKLMGSDLNMSSSHHLQSDGQTKRFNGFLEEDLRYFMSANKDCVRHFM